LAAIQKRKMTPEFEVPLQKPEIFKKNFLTSQISMAKNLI